MKCAPTERSSLRLRAIGALYRGMEREVVRQFCNVSERTILYWIERFNDRGIDGLIQRGEAGRPRKIERQEVKATVLELVDNPQKAGQEHWTGRKLHGYLTEALKLEVGYSTLLRREEFVKRLEGWCADPEVEIWFADESGIEGDPRPRRRWVKRGSRPRVPYEGTHIRANVLGAICPATGQLVSLIFDYCDTNVFQALIDTLQDEAAPTRAKRRILIMDNASWHKTKRLNWHSIEPAYLPPYSPDFNPIERLWLRLKADFFSDFIAKTPDQLVDRICKGINDLMIGTKCKLLWTKPSKPLASMIRNTVRSGLMAAFATLAPEEKFIVISRAKLS